MIVLTEAQYAMLRWIGGEGYQQKVEKPEETLKCLGEMGLVRATPNFTYVLTRSGRKVIGK